MKPSFSLYLDVVRFGAALIVLVSHAVSQPFARDLTVPGIHSLGSAAVTVFFVLSGFVIAHVVAGRENDPRTYAIARFSRLYSVVLPALLLTWVLDTTGDALNPGFYADPKVFADPPGVTGYLTALGFVNEYQILHLDGLAPGSNAPFWSISFEVAYYLAAGLLLFARRWLAVLAVGLLLCLAGRTIAAMAPLWALGFVLYRWRGERVFRPRLAPLLAGLSALLLLAMPVLNKLMPNDNFGVHMPWGRHEYNRNLIADYLTAVLFAVHLGSMRVLLAGEVAWLARCAGAIRWLGALTFPLYLMHFPLICLLAGCGLAQAAPWLAAPCYIVASLALVALLTPLCEWLKRVFRDWLGARFPGRGSAAA